MTSLLLRKVLLTAAMLMLASPAQAEEPDEQVLLEAESLLSEANAHYAAERYEEARAAYEAAYDLTGAAGFLYNIAQSHRLAGQCRPAIEFYEEFLADDPKTPLRSKVEGFVADMWTCLEKEKQAAAAEEARRERKRSDAESAAAELSPADSSLAMPSAEPESQPKSPLPIVGLAIVGTGVLALGTSAYFGLKTRSLSQEAESFEGVWGPAQESDEKDAQSAERLSIVLGIAGGTAVLAGLTIYLLAGDEGDAGLALHPSSHGAMLSFSSSY